jgi:hypothetical protein
MTLETITSISQIVGTATIVGGMIFGLIQLSEFKKQRRDAVAAELMRAFMDPEFARAITIIKAIPDGASAEEILQGGAETERAALLVNTTFETMGLLTYERIAPFPLVVKLAGGIVVVLWRKLAPWANQLRSAQSQPSWAEWFQWLAQQCERHKTTEQPAYIQHRSWVP